MRHTLLCGLRGLLGLVMLAMGWLIVQTASAQPKAATRPVATTPASSTMPALSLQAATYPTIDQLAARLEHATVNGQVVDKQGQPIAGAAVFLYFRYDSISPRNRLMARTTTDAGGAFSFEKALVWEPKLEETSYDYQECTVIAQHPAHGLEFMILQPGDEPHVTIRMDAPRTQKVTVTDEAGAPVAGASVTLDMGSHSKEVAQTQTGRYAACRIFGDIGLGSPLTGPDGVAIVPAFPGDCSFTVEKEGYAHTHCQGDSKALLCKSASLSGHVRYADGAPAAGAIVSFRYSGVSVGDELATVADAEGYYAFKNAPAKGYRWEGLAPESEKDALGSVRLTAVDPRPGSPAVGVSVALTVKPGDLVTQDLQLVRGCELSGQVIEVTTSQPAPGVAMYLYQQPPGSSYLGSQLVRTDAQGRFRICVEPGANVQMQWQESRDGSYVIDDEWRYTGQDNYQPLRSQVVTKDLTGLQLKLKLWQLGELKGRVQESDGAPAKNVAVHLHNQIPSVNTDEQGRFLFKHAPRDREFDLCAISSDSKRATVAHLSKGAAQATLTLAPTLTLNGFAKTTDGTPAPDLNFHIYLWLNGQANYTFSNITKTDREGRFVLSGLIPGRTYNFNWSADNEQNRDYDSGNADVDLAKLQPDQPISFEAKRYINTLLGKVVNTKGEPIAGTRITWDYTELMPQDLRYSSKVLATDKNGEFTLSRLAAGRLQLCLEADGYRSQTFTTDTDNVDFRAVLGRFGESYDITLNVTDETNRPLADAPLVLFLRRYTADGKWQVERLTTTSDKDGMARFTVPTTPLDANTEAIVYCDTPERAFAAAAVRVGTDQNISLNVPKGNAIWTGKILNAKGEPVTGAKIEVGGLRPPSALLRSSVSAGVSATGAPIVARTAGFRGPAAVLWPRDAAQAAVIQLSAVTDAAGVFELPRVSRQWAATIYVSAPGYATYSGLLDPRTEEKSPTITLADAGTLKGRLVLKGASHAPALQGNALLSLFSRQTGARASLKVQSDGSFEDRALTPGTYQASLTLASPADAHIMSAVAAPVDIKAGAAAELAIEVWEGIPVRGRFVSPLKTPTSVGIMADGKLIELTQADKEGRWVLYVPAPGNYEIRYGAAGTTLTPFRSVSVEAGKPVEEILVN